MTISAALVKDLRQATGAGMMDCKKALTETGGDLDLAIDWLRTKGLSAAAKKASRVASEGLVGVMTDGVHGASAGSLAGSLVEVNAETDFVARNEEFQALVRQITLLALTAESCESLGAMDYPDTGRTVAEELTHKIATIGENMALRRMAKISVGEGLVVPYIHNTVAEGLGRIGVLVGLESSAPADILLPLGKQLAMHIAATNPQSLTPDDLDSEVLAKERQILLTQALQSGKPADIAEKMVEGRMKKFIKESVLLEQISVIDGESPINQVIAAAAQGAGTPITLTRFARFNLGEGIDKETSDFAAEVAAQLGA